MCLAGAPALAFHRTNQGAFDELSGGSAAVANRTCLTFDGTDGWNRTIKQVRYQQPENHPDCEASKGPQGYGAAGTILTALATSDQDER